MNGRFQPARRNGPGLALDLLVLSLIVFGLASPAAAQKSGLGGLDDLKSDILSDLQGDTTAKDLDGLRYSHLSVIETWDAVEPYAARSKVAGREYRWKTGLGFVSPLGSQPIATLVDVPRGGEYRLYLRHWLSQKQTHPIVLTIEPYDAVTGKTSSSAPLVRHTFGEKRLLSGTLGKDQEKKLSIRVESDVQLNTFPNEAAFVWEYVDVKLPQGPHRLSLQSDDLQARAHSVFLTQSKTFRPSFSEVKKDNTFEAVYMRYRVVEGAEAPQYSLTMHLTYHWRGRKAGNSTEPLWYDSMGTLSKIPAKEWSPYVDVREQTIPGGGPYSTLRTSFAGVKHGRVEVEFSWHPHAAAVVRTFQTAVSDGKTMFRVPHGRYSFRTPAAKPQWGVWDAEILAGLLPEEAIVEKYFAWAEAAAKTLGVAADHPKPKHVHVLSSCRVGVAHKARAAEMLAKLGVNWIPDAPPEIAAKYGLYQETDTKKVKLGDEIGTRQASATVNDDATMRAGFHAYLREQAALQGTTVEELLGVDDLDDVECLEELPPNAGRYERRLFYYSERYRHVATIAYYARELRNVERTTPGAIVYNNYSPHPLFLTGRDMNFSDWFLLPRAGAQTLGWAEDWATGGGWGLGTPAAECTTFYASLVDCAVRTHGYPSGFYVGSNCGYSAQKMFSCVSQGISILHLYDWGPIDAWAEGSNAWSEIESQYLSIMQGTHALGPADEIVAHGKREPRRTALLYNRTHEIVSGSKVWLNRDWMWTFLALRNSQIPVDVVIEEDLTDAGLDGYDVLFVGGLNLERRHLKALRAWVERGGVLIASAGFAERDAFDDRLPETVELFGAEQRVADTDDAAARGAIRFAGGEEFPAVELQAAAAGDRKYILKPTTGRAIAAYDGGQVAAVANTVGRGKTILLGVTTGEMYRAAGGAVSPARTWLTAPVVAKLGRSRAEFSCPQSEVTRFDHASGTAVLVALYARTAEELPNEPARLSIWTDRPVKEVVSALHGPCKWKQVGDRIEIETLPPAQWVVDSFILR
jgi:hypothetical protein